MSTSNSLTETQIEELRDALRGRLLEPGHDGYDQARQLWNRLIDKHPGAIAKCTGTADVIECVNFVRERNIQFSVKSGGHHVSGTAVCDDGLVIDLSAMNGVHVNLDEETVRVQGGATWGDVDHETQAFGLATVGGQDPNIGVAGQTLGGGIGWLSRRYGLTIDNLLEVDVVTANGNLVTASENENPNLFWALRGGGGNFGVATSFKFELHEVGPEVLAGSLIHPFEDAAEVAAYYEDYMEEASDNVRTLFGILVLGEESYLPAELHNQRVAIVVSLYAGDPDEGREELAPLRDFGDPITDSIKTRPYTAFQRAGTSDEPWRVYLRSQYLEALPQEAIDVIIEYSEDMPSWGSSVFLSHRGGAETLPSRSATAYSHRHDAFHILIEARWEDPAADFEHKEWVHQFHRALQPYTTGEAAMNFLTKDELEGRVRAAYGENYDRLVEIKNEWDPENLFRMNQNIKPTVNNE